MYGHTLHCGRKHLSLLFTRFQCRKILSYIKDCFKFNGKQRIVMPKKGEFVTFKNYERKIKSLIIIYADFESILVPGDNRKQNLEQSYTNKYQKHNACSYGY